VRIAMVDDNVSWEGFGLFRSFVRSFVGWCKPALTMDMAVVESFSYCRVVIVRRNSASKVRACKGEHRTRYFGLKEVGENIVRLRRRELVLDDDARHIVSRDQLL